MTMETTVLEDWQQLIALEESWRELMARSDANEPTLSPLWLNAWWRVFGDDGRMLTALVFREHGRLVGLAPLLSRRARHRRLVPLRRLELVGSGENEADEICSDYIGIIAERGAEERVARAFAEAAAAGAMGPFDELVLELQNGLSALPAQLAAALNRVGLDTVLERQGAAPYVLLPESWDAYLAGLSSSRRYLVRRSLRDLEKWGKGPVTYTRVEGPAELSEGQRILLELHEKRWQEEGRSGLFASQRFTDFHFRVMPELLAIGALDLAWIHIDGKPIAVVYSLVWNGKVYFYQGGRETGLPPKLRPGIAVHALAIADSIQRGRREYDFLNGTSRYKMQLASHVRPLVRLHATRRRRPAIWARRALDLAAEHTRSWRNRSEVLEAHDHEDADE